MNPRTRHIHRRRRAIDRLRSLTTGAAVAGVAGTAGFGFLAATSWSGDPTASTAADIAIEDGGAANGATNDDPAPSLETEPGTVFGTVPNTGRSSGATRIRPAQPGSRIHATSGGSR